jgi:SAM-dependent methyltransferase
VGAGTGSYEPANRAVTAVEPSTEMIRRRAAGLAPAVQGSAERLPFADRAFDAALALLTVHHWKDRARGLAELRRVACDRIVIFTFDPDHPSFWLLRDYLPEIAELDRSMFPSLAELERLLGPVEVQCVPIPADCSDGFLGAYWRRPAAYLDPRVRAAISAFSLVDATAAIARLRRDLADGTWSARNGTLAALHELDIGYRLVLARCT